MYMIHDDLILDKLAYLTAAQQALTNQIHLLHLNAEENVVPWWCQKNQELCSEVSDHTCIEKEPQLNIGGEMKGELLCTEK